MNNAMTLDLYQVDSFTSRQFSGNPAAVVPLQAWLPDEQMQAIALENNLSETAFFIENGETYDLRWFTPTDEVDLCGHATLASAYVLYQYLGYRGDCIRFETRSGTLTVERESGGMVMDMPASFAEAAALPEAISEALGDTPLWSGLSNYWLLQFESVQQIRDLKPDFARLLAVSDKNLIVTAAGDDCDFVSRFFAPHVGVNEDPVTGSAHCILAPFWARYLDKQELLARQLSARGGELTCTVQGDRVRLLGQCAPYLIGQIYLQ